MRTVLYVSVLRSMEDLLSNAPSEADLTNMIFYITSNSMIRIFNHNHTIIIYHPFYSYYDSLLFIFYYVYACSSVRVVCSSFGVSWRLVVDCVQANILAQGMTSGRSR